ncbi:hypothetical protein KFE98_12955 [bacterium SCSIO 12741]|nr:hypothetical protein KFE98_12955 [bacterium SCSIO 12741]
MATEAGIGNLKQKVDLLIEAYQTRLSENKLLRKENELLKQQIEELRGGQMAPSGVDSNHKDRVRYRIDELVKEVDKCIEILKK